MRSIPGAGDYAPSADDDQLRTHVGHIEDGLRALDGMLHSEPAQAYRSNDKFVEALAILEAQQWSSLCASCAPTQASANWAQPAPPPPLQEAFVSNTPALSGNADLLDLSRTVDPQYSIGPGYINPPIYLYRGSDYFGFNSPNYYVAATVVVGSKDRGGFSIIFGYSDSTMLSNRRVGTDYYQLTFGMSKTETCPSTSLEAGTVRLYRVATSGGGIAKIYSEPYVLPSDKTITVFIYVRAGKNITTGYHHNDISVFIREEFPADSALPPRPRYRFTFRDHVPQATYLPRGGTVGIAGYGTPSLMIGRVRIGVPIQSPSGAGSDAPRFPGFFRSQAITGATAPLLRTYYAFSSSDLAQSIATTFYMQSACNNATLVAFFFPNNLLSPVVDNPFQSARTSPQGASMTLSPGGVFGFSTNCFAGAAVSVPFTNAYGSQSNNYANPLVSNTETWRCRRRIEPWSLTQSWGRPGNLQSAQGFAHPIVLGLGSLSYPMPAFASFITAADAFDGVECYIVLPYPSEVLRLFTRPVAANISTATGIVPTYPYTQDTFGSPRLLAHNSATLVPHNVQVVHLTDSHATSAHDINIFDPTNMKENDPRMRLYIAEIYPNQVQTLPFRLEPNELVGAATVFVPRFSFNSVGTAVIRVASSKFISRGLSFELTVSGVSDRRLFCQLSHNAPMNVVHGNFKPVPSAIRACSTSTFALGVITTSVTGLPTTEADTLPDIYITVWLSPMNSPSPVSEILPSHQVGSPILDIKIRPLHKPAIIDAEPTVPNPERTGVPIITSIIAADIGLNARFDMPGIGETGLAYTITSVLQNGVLRNKFVVTCPASIAQNTNLLVSVDGSINTDERTIGSVAIGPVIDPFIGCSFTFVFVGALANFLACRLPLRFPPGIRRHG